MKTLFAPMRLAMIAALLLSVAPLAAQDIYKCTKNGQLVYTDRPCPGSTGQLIHKADDTEIIDQYLRLGQNDRAQQYAQSRHLETLYQERLAAYQQTQQEKADRQVAEALAAQQREELAQQKALADAAARHDRLLDENDELREQNDAYRDQLAEPVYNAPPAYWNGVPPYGYGGRGDHNHYDPRPHRPRPTTQQPVFHPCTQLAGGRVNC